MTIALLDYGAGNVRSIRNAVQKLGFSFTEISSAEDILTADKVLFPGVGSFGLVMAELKKRGYVEPLRQRILAGKPFLGICVALQVLYAGSEESPGVAGLGIFPGQVQRFATGEMAVPQIGWNGVKLLQSSSLFNGYQQEKLYFVHSYFAPLTETPDDWQLAYTDYGCKFVSAVAKGAVAAFQFHPEKSGAAGLNILSNYLQEREEIALFSKDSDTSSTKIAKRIIACLDVRSNDAGDLVVTKGDQYAVRAEGEVRNLGKPVALARRYYEEGADEITFLNITGFRSFPLQDQPMIDLLAECSKEVFVPLTIGGGIRAFIDSMGRSYSALDVAAAYFRAGADKISIGSDAVDAVEEFLRSGKKSGSSSIEQISAVYGAQAVVISVDPRRVYVDSAEATPHTTVKTTYPGPNGEEYCWYQCTVKGGREERDLDVIQFVVACEQLGAGEILLNCIDRDGTGSGFELELIAQVKAAVSIPVIASSGAGSAAHFVELFTRTEADAGLAAGIFHRREVEIDNVKKAARAAGVEVR